MFFLYSPYCEVSGRVDQEKRTFFSEFKGKIHKKGNLLD